MKKLIKQFLEKNPHFNTSFIKGMDKCEDQASLKIYLAKLTLKLVDKIEKNKVDKEEISRVYLFLNHFIESNFPTMSEEREVYNILFDGQIMYHYGDDIQHNHGPDIEMMKKSANNILRRY